MNVIAVNRKAFHEYEIKDTVEAGLVLHGAEVKSVRRKQVSISDAFATIHGGQLVLLNSYIAPYSHAYSKGDDPRRTRGLLLHRREIDRLAGDISKKGLTLIPLKHYINNRGYVKVELGIAKHKKLHEKKKTLKERDIKREVSREVKVKMRIT